MSSILKSENYAGGLLDYNPAERNLFDFTEKVPSILDIGISKLNWILAAQVFIYGVDLSHWNWSDGRMPDFKIIKANGFDFVILKATESDWFVDERFEAGWMAALDAGLIAIPYHFNRTNKGGAAQAHWHLTNITDYLRAVDGKTICWNDIETNDGGTIVQHQNRAKAYNQTIVENGLETGNYSSYYLWKLVMGSTPLPWVYDYHQWVAHWTPNVSPIMPIGWNRKEFWQYGIWPKHSWAKVVGTDGNVDVNRFYGTLKDLKKLLGINDIPSDCCEEVKKELNEIYIRLATLDEHAAVTDQRLAAHDNNYLSTVHRFELIEDEIGKIQLKLAGVEIAQKATHEQVQSLLNLLQEVRTILC